VADAQELPFDADAFDVVIANHMLYHVPAPETAVAELARVLCPDGVLMASTSGPHHLAELWEIRAEVFGGPPESVNPEVFGSITGGPILRRSFARVEWRAYGDTLLCTSADDVVAFLSSAPPGQDATPDQRTELERAVEGRFETDGGVLAVTQETGFSWPPSGGASPPFGRRRNGPDPRPVLRGRSPGRRRPSPGRGPGSGSAPVRPIRRGACPGRPRGGSGR